MVNVDQVHLHEYEAHYQRLLAEDPEAHVKDVAGLIDSPKNIKLYRLDAIDRCIQALKRKINNA